MEEELKVIEVKDIQNKIYNIRNEQVMIDSDLAELYNVPVKRLNEQVKRNIDRFPEKFRFQLTKEEQKKYENSLRSQIATSSLEHGGRRYLPYAFTEQGVAMLSAVLRSETAVKMSVQIMDAFVNMRRFISSNAAIFTRIDSVEKNLLEYKTETDSKFNKIFEAIEEKEIKPKQGIFFDGQIFDAYKFLIEILEDAENSIFIIDNYIDESILTILTKRKPNVDVIIFTKSITKQMKLDVTKYNEQYPKVELVKLNKAHDRFIVIDNKVVYHLGASLKDLGKKWFAFTKMENDTITLIKQLNNILK